MQYAWVRLAMTDGGGDSKRVKFVLLAWLGPTCPALAKMRCSEHKALLASVKPTHVTLTLTEREELKTLASDVDTALRRAGGADYDAGNAAAGVKAGHSSSVKSSSKAFFLQKDKETEIKAAVFEKHVRSGKDISACDLGNRAMTASATDARKNTVGYTVGGTPPASGSVARTGGAEPRTC